MNISQTTPSGQQASSSAKTMQGFVPGAWVAPVITAVAHLGVNDAINGRPRQCTS